MLPHMQSVICLFHIPCVSQLQRDRDKRGQQVTQHVVEKINHLAHQSIKYFDLFLATLKDRSVEC